MSLFAPAVVCDLSFKSGISAGLISLPAMRRSKNTRFCRDSVFQERPFLGPLRHIPLYLITICSKKLQLSCAMILDPEKGAVSTEHSSHRHGLSRKGAFSVPIARYCGSRGLRESHGFYGRRSFVFCLTNDMAYFII